MTINDDDSATSGRDGTEPDNLSIGIYEFEEGDGELVAGILDRLGTHIDDPVALSLACYQDPQFAGMSVPLQSETTTLLGFELDDESTDGSVHLTPVTGPRSGLEVRAIQEASEQSHALWRSILAHAQLPLVSALLCDALLTARAESGVEHAARTVNHYIAVCNDESVDDLHRGFAIARANTIARRRQMTQEESVRAAALAFSELEVRAEVPDGIVARVLLPLSVAPKTYIATDGERAQIRSILDLAASLYQNPSSADWIADCRRNLATNNAEHLDATRQQLAQYIATAESEEVGFRKMHWASAAADLAGRYGDTESRDRAIQLMQTIQTESLGWKVQESTLRLPVSVLRRHLRRYKHAVDWRQGLQIFLGSTSPSGDHEQNKASSRLASAGSIRRLVSRITFGSHGLPEREGGDFDEEELVRTEQLIIGSNGICLDLELREIEQRFGRPSEPEITSWMSATFGCDHEHARQFAHALHLHWEESASDSARVSIPLVEAGARRLLLLLNEPIYRLERGSSPGRFPAMDFYIDKLEELELDPDWASALRTALLSPGANARNMAAHGFKFDFTPSEAAVLIRLAGLFCAMPIRGEIEADRSALRAPLPPNRPPRRRWRWHRS